MKLTARQIQNIIKEELNRVIKESQKIYSVVAAIQRAFKFNKGTEAEKKKLVNKLFDAYESISPSESEFARKWIDIFYKEYEGFQKIVNADKLLKYRYFHSPPKPEFVSTQKDISDTSNTPTGMTTYDFDPYLLFNRLKGKNLAGKNLSGKDLTHLDLTGTNLNEADLSGADLSGVDLRGAKLRRANLNHARLSKADLTGTNLYRAKLIGADLRYANLSGADLRYANPSVSKLRGANLSYADLGQADLTWADLRGANLSYANLGEGDLTSYRVVGANLSNANLRGANLTGARLEGAELKGAFYDEETKWPKGFDPIKAGAKRV